MASLETSMGESLSVRLLANSRRFIRWVTTPHVLLSLIMLVILYYMVVIPLYRMVNTTLTWQPRDVTNVPGAVLGEFTFYHYVRMLTGALGQIYMFTPLRHSFTVAIGSTLLSLLIGGSLAWLVIRTDMPGRKLVNQLALIPYIMPSWTLAQAWLVFFKSTSFSGGTPGLYEFLVGQAPPSWLSYGPVPIIICSALHYYTFFFLFVSAALMSIDSSLEEAGDLMGASRWRILRKITLPLVVPAILSGFIMTFSKVLGTFGGPNILGTPVRYYVVATMIRGSMGVGDKADAFVLAIVLILFSVITIYINQRLIGTRKSYETIGGRGFMAQLSKLGKWKRVMLSAAITFQILVIVVPLGLLIWSSLMLQDGNYSLSNLSLQHWIGERGTIFN
ncbi:MAG: iron ABC transporter permease, partial [Chloroflexota bacterium]